MNFDNKDFDMFEKDFALATQDLCDKYQLKLKTTKISYGEVEFDMKITFEKNEEGVNAERIKFEAECAYYGFVPEDYLRLFFYKGAEYEFLGFARSAKKYNCIVREVETGEEIRINDRYLRSLFEQEMMDTTEPQNETMETVNFE